MSLQAHLNGELKVTLHCSGSDHDALVTDVEVTSSRPLRATSMFVGKSIDEVLQLINTLYSVCANSQTCAAVRAIENSIGHVASTEVNVIRQAAVDMESLREHLWRILLDWPKHLQHPPNHHSLARAVLLQQRFEQAIGNLYNWFMPRAQPQKVDIDAALEAVNNMQSLIEIAVLNMSCEQWLALPDMQAIQAHFNPTLPALALLQHIEEKNWSAACTSTVKQLPLINDSNADYLIGQIQHWSFIEKPLWQHTPRETTSLVRNHSPLLASVIAQHGNGLLARAVALLSEVAELGQRLRQLFCNNRVHYEAYSDLQVRSAYPLGQVSAARGQLFHWLRLDIRGLDDYRILAPTEWNFHPRGVIAEGLISLKGPIGDIKEQTALLIELVDPCVGYQLNIHHTDSQREALNA